MKTTFQLRIESEELNQIKDYALSNNTGVSDVFRDGAKLVITGKTVVHTTSADGEDYGAVIQGLEDKIKKLESELVNARRSIVPKDNMKVMEIVGKFGGHVQTANNLNENGLLDKPTDSEPLFPVKSAQKPITAIFKNPKVNSLLDRFTNLCPKLNDEGIKTVSGVITQWEDMVDAL